MGEVGFPELLVILAIALVVFGGKRLPEIARSMGQSIHAFKRGLKEGKQADEELKSPEAKPREQRSLRGGEHGAEEQKKDRSSGGPQSPTN